MSVRPSDALLTSNEQTSIMAVQFKDGVVIGADSRTTMGSYIVRHRICDIRGATDLPWHRRIE